jgi:hypothetical protein
MIWMSLTIGKGKRVGSLVKGPAWMTKINCAGPNSGRILSQINAVWIVASQGSVSRIPENFGALQREGVGRSADHRGQPDR